MLEPGFLPFGPPVRRDEGECFAPFLGIGMKLGFTGVVSNVKSKGNKFDRSENVFPRGRPKIRNSRFLAFLRHLVHHFQKLRRAGAQSNSL